MINFASPMSPSLIDPSSAAPLPAEIQAFVRARYGDGAAVINGEPRAQSGAVSAGLAARFPVIVVSAESPWAADEHERIRAMLAKTGAAWQRTYSYGFVPGRPSLILDVDAWAADESSWGVVSLLRGRAIGAPQTEQATSMTMVVAGAAGSDPATAEGAAIAWTTDLPGAVGPWRRTRQLVRADQGWRLVPVEPMDSVTSGPLTARDCTSQLPPGESGEDVLAHLLNVSGVGRAPAQRAIREWTQAATSTFRSAPGSHIPLDVQPRNFVVDGNGWQFIDNGLGAHFPFPPDVFILRAVVWLLVQRVLHREMPGVATTATVRDVADIVMRVCGRPVSDAMIELWTQLEADLETRTQASSRSHETIVRELNDLLSTPILALLVGAPLSQRISAERAAGELSLATAQEKVLTLEHEQTRLAKQLAATRREAADLNAKLVNLELAVSRQGGRRGRGATVRRRLMRARDAAGTGLLSGLATNPLFDASWYRDRYEDVRTLHMNPYRHFRRHGWREGRDPNPLFDTDWYLERYPDVRDTGMSPLDHFLRFGADEGRDPGPFFDTRWYLDSYPDVATTALNPLVHFLRYGQAEGRLACSPQRRVREVVSEAVQGTGMARSRRASGRARRALNRMTLFVHDRAERAALENLAPAAKQRGFEVEFSDVFDLPSDIGIYCTHSPLPTRSRFSVAMFHDMGQEGWPDDQVGDENQWRLSPWNEFDLGILPGRTWTDAWRRFSSRPSARPRLGVFELGWPKADGPFADIDGFANRVEDLRRSLGLPNQPSVLYALSWENPAKQEALLAALRDLPVNVLIKPQPDVGPNQRRLGRNVAVIDSTADILECLALADLVVSDESSVIVEALLFSVGTVAVSDWEVPALPGLYPYRDIATPGETPVERRPLVARSPLPPRFVTTTPEARLRPAVERALSTRAAARWRLAALRDQWFSHLGRSSELIIDVIDAALTGSPWPVEPLAPEPPR